MLSIDYAEILADVEEILHEPKNRQNNFCIKCIIDRVLRPAHLNQAISLSISCLLSVHVVI